MADAVAVDSGVAKYQMEMVERGEAEYKILADEFVKEVYGIGFKKGNTELRDQVQETLLEMVKDGKFAEIAAKWDKEHGKEDYRLLYRTYDTGLHLLCGFVS